MITKDENGTLIIAMDTFSCDGETVTTLQKALLLALEELASSDQADSKAGRVSIFYLSSLLKSCLLTNSQNNVALGGQPYKDDLKITKGASKQA